MSLSKSKCWYSNNSLHFLKCAVPLQVVSSKTSSYLVLHSCVKILGAMTLSIMTLSKWRLHVTISISDTQHNNAQPLWWVSLCRVSHFIYCYDECHYGQCHYDECRGAKYSTCKIWGKKHIKVVFLYWWSFKSHPTYIYLFHVCTYFFSSFSYH